MGRGGRSLTLLVCACALSLGSPPPPLRDGVPGDRVVERLRQAVRGPEGVTWVDRTLEPGGAGARRGARTGRARDFLRQSMGLRRACSQHVHCSEGEFCGNARACQPCDECAYNMDSIDGFCPTSKCPEGPTTAERDVMPPRMHWLFVEPTSIDVSIPNPGSSSQSVRQWVDLWMYVSDPGSGLYMAEFRFMNAVQTKGIRFFAYAEYDLDLGTEKKGTFERNFWFETADDGGEWRLWQVLLIDRNENQRVYNSQDVFLMHQKGDVNASVDVKSNYYSTCDGPSSEYVYCSQHDAACVDTWRPNNVDRVGVCVCNPGFYGDSFNCLRNGLNYTNVDHEGQVYSIETDEERTNSGGRGEEDSWGAEEREEGQGHYGTSAPAASSAANPPFSNNQGQGWKDGWSSMDTQMASTIIAIGLVAVFCVQCRRYNRHLRLMLMRQRDSRIQHDDDDDSDGADSFGGHSRGSRQLRALRQRERLDQLSWLHEVVGGGGRGRAPGRGGGGDGSGDLTAAQQFDLMQMQQLYQEDAGGRRGRRRGGNGGRIEPQIVTLNAVAGMMMPPPTGPPREPQPVCLPDHLMIPGRVPDASVAEGEECAVCMEQAKGARLVPCGHKDLCYDCAEHIRKHGGDCPMCRAKIQSVRKGKE